MIIVYIIFGIIYQSQFNYSFENAFNKILPLFSETFDFEQNVINTSIQTIYIINNQ